MSSLLPSPLFEALNPYIDIPFNLYLLAILTLAYTCIIHSLGRKLLLAIVIATDVLIVYFDSTSTTSGLIKIQAELVGLAVVLGFLVAPRSWQVKHLSDFTVFVNFAVYGNIGMMVGTPSGGTTRGWCCKFACLSLFVWVVRYRNDLVDVDRSMLNLCAVSGQCVPQWRCVERDASFWSCRLTWHPNSPV
jgi:hypothetical protein